MVISDIPDPVITAESSASSQSVTFVEFTETKKSPKPADNTPVAGLTNVKTTTAKTKPVKAAKIPTAQEALDQVLNHPAFRQTEVGKSSVDVKEKEAVSKQVAQVTDEAADPEINLRNLSLNSLEDLAVSDITVQVKTTEVPASSKSFSAEKTKVNLQETEDTDAVNEQPENESVTAENYMGIIDGEFALGSQFHQADDPSEVFFATTDVEADETGQSPGQDSINRVSLPEMQLSPRY